VFSVDFGIVPFSPPLSHSRKWREKGEGGEPPILKRSQSSPTTHNSYNSYNNNNGPAKKDDFCGITAKNADQKRFFSNFVGLAPYP
jgi:hypothetical protein